MVTKKLNLSSLTATQIKIAEYLKQGIFAVEIAKRLHISESTVSRHIKKLIDSNYIAQSRREVLNNKAIVYNISKELLAEIELRKRSDKTQLTSLIPHNVQWKCKITEQNGEIALDNERFAKIHFKWIKTFTPHKNDARNVFEMRGTYGRYQIVISKTGLNITCIDRELIPAKDIIEATEILSMDLKSAIETFISEQRSGNCYITISNVSKVGSPHYAIESKLAYDAVVAKGKTQLQITPDIFIDNSPSTHGKTGIAEWETKNQEAAFKMDYAIRNFDKFISSYDTIKETNALLIENKALMTTSNDIGQHIIELLGGNGKQMEIFCKTILNQNNIQQQNLYTVLQKQNQLNN